MCGKPGFATLLRKGWAEMIDRQTDRHTACHREPWNSHDRSANTSNVQTLDSGCLLYLSLRFDSQRFGNSMCRGRGRDSLRSVSQSIGWAQPQTVSPCELSVACRQE